MNSFYSNDELNQLGLSTFGENVMISKKSSIYGAKDIRIGNDVRIDDFCILSGKINIGNFIHIAPYSACYGGKTGITIEDFVNISSKVAIYAISDDYSGRTMTNPMIPNKYKDIMDASVVIRRHVIIGTGCVVLPGVVLEEGSSYGALTLINRNSEEWSINVGIPFRKIKERDRSLLKLEEEFKTEYCLKMRETN